MTGQINLFAQRMRTRGRRTRTTGMICQDSVNEWITEKIYIVPHPYKEGKATCKQLWVFHVVPVAKNTPVNAEDLIRDTGSNPGWGRSPGGGYGNPLQYSCLENPHGQRSLAGHSPQDHEDWSNLTHTNKYKQSNKHKIRRKKKNKGKTLISR